MSLILEAAKVCRIAHEGQMRKFTTEPYCNHPARVAARVSLIPNATEEMVAAAYLHDVLEDTEMTADDLMGFGVMVLGYVWDLTDHYTKEAYPNNNREWRKEMEAKRIAALPEAVINIKLADILDNLTGQDPADAFAPVFFHEKMNLLTLIGDKGDFQLKLEVFEAGKRLRAAGMNLAPKYWDKP